MFATKAGKGVIPAGARGGRTPKQMKFAMHKSRRRRGVPAHLRPGARDRQKAAIMKGFTKFGVKGG
jgi:hypothetical protein